MNDHHTPGPWRNEGNKVIAGKGFSGVVAEIREHETTEGAFNAQLIASAPALLDALRAMLAAYDGADSIGAADMAASAAATARAAIRAAGLEP